MKLVTAFRLGRVSNLPTVWSNVLAGAALAGAGVEPFVIGLLLLAMSLVYTAGMFFNDVFDREFDRRHRPDRPIPAGEATTVGVTLGGSAMMLAALALLAYQVTLSAQAGWLAVIAGALLCLLVLLYDFRHKGNPFGPLLMGSCRAMVYITVALAVSSGLSLPLVIAALCLGAWVLGLTMVAKRQNIFAGFGVLVASVLAVIFIVAGDALSLTLAAALAALSVALIYGAVYLCRDGKYWNPVTLLIAGMSLLDALVIVGVTGSFAGLALLAAGMFLLTLMFQRFIEGS